MFLVELYAFREAVQLTGRQYFEGQSALFPNLNDQLVRLVERTEWLAEPFNDIFACGSAKLMVDLEWVRKAA
jgi:hypothetical protein